MLPVIYHARIQAKLEKGARGLEKGNRPEGKRIIKAQKKHWHKNQTFQKFLAIYTAYVRECIFPQFQEYDGEAMLYQAEPILRVVFPGSVASAKLHSDSEFWHQCNEVNYWCPLTDVAGANSLWSESTPGQGEAETGAEADGRMGRKGGKCRFVMIFVAFPCLFCMCACVLAALIFCAASFH